MGLSLLSAQRMCSLTAWLIKTSKQLFSHSQKRIDSCLDCFMLKENQIKQCSLLDQLVMMMDFYHVALPFVSTACPVCTMYVPRMCVFVHVCSHPGIVIHMHETSWQCDLGEMNVQRPGHPDHSLKCTGGRVMGM